MGAMASFLAGALREGVLRSVLLKTGPNGPLARHPSAILTGDKMNPKASKLASLLGSASLLTMANVMAAQAQQIAQAQTAQATPMEVPEQVLITGSLIHGTAAVGVPVTNLSPQDFAQTGALTTSDLFR